MITEEVLNAVTTQYSSDMMPESAKVILKCTKNDNVNHPSHYETGKFECIEVMLETQGVEAVKNFCICNAFKYLYRHGRKNGLEDVKKAGWYIRKYIELEEGNANEDREQGNQR